MIELDAADTRLETRDGRRVIVIHELGGAEVVLALPTRDPERPAYRLLLAMEQIVAAVRGDARHDAHRGGLIIAGPSGPE